MDKPAPTPEEILKLYDELGRPSATKFAAELRSTYGMRVTPAEVQRNIVGLQAERQVAARLPKYEGKSILLGWTNAGSLM